MTLRKPGVFGHSHTHTDKFCFREMAGPNFGEKDWQTEMILNLQEIRYDVCADRKKRGKPRSQEDLFMMAGIQSACHSKLITNDYRLRIELGYDGCTCCSNVPDASLPISVLPIVNPQCFGFQPPNGWLPNNLGAFTINFQAY